MQCCIHTHTITTHYARYTHTVYTLYGGREWLRGMHSTLVSRVHIRRDGMPPPYIAILTELRCPYVWITKPELSTEWHEIFTSG